MYPELLNHIARFITLDESETELLRSILSIHNFKKKEHLLQEGQVCDAQFFIVKGCCRMYIINEKGYEQTLQFGIENWWISDYLSFQGNAPSHFNIQAIENLSVIKVRSADLEILFAKIPKLERYFRIGLQKSFGAAQMRIKFLFTMSAEQRYHNMNNAFPEFVQRVPQYMLASYLDFSPEFLSKIRAKRSS